MRKSKMTNPVYITGINGYQNFRNVNEFHDKYNRGDYSKVSEKTGFSPSYVWRVLNGERFNPTIASTAKRLVSRRQITHSGFSW